MTTIRDMPTDPASHGLERRHWDAIVIGTGMGGATIGLALAQAGKRVLFCERGRYRRIPGGADSGAYPEELSSDGRVPSAEELLRAGRFESSVIDASNQRERRFVPFVGCGGGGSTALYGMALERFFPVDFEPRAAHPDATESSLEEVWPISYGRLVPYYAAAESLFRIRGGADALRPIDAVPFGPMPPPALTPGGEELFALLQARGMQPYRLPQACEFVSGCQGCQGFLCPLECKNDSERICLTPAIRDEGAEIVDECEVLQLVADARRISEVVCHRHGRELRFRGTIVVVAAGALQTPALLLRSRSGDWPDGLANGSGLVGRNLMRHFIDLHCVETNAARRPGFDNRFKEIGCNAFYQSAHGKLGTLQSFGRLPPAQSLFEALRDDANHGPLRWLARGLPLVRPLLMPTLHGLVETSTVLASIVEDLPYADNRVTPLPGSHDRLRIDYRIRPREAARIEQSRRLVQAALSPHRRRFIAQAENNQRIAHACGTCRFGDDPRTSVLDSDNRAHGIDNLYVVDASFFPSSGGTNPALTIAANALRVAENIVAAV